MIAIFSNNQNNSTYTRSSSPTKFILVTALLGIGTTTIAYSQRNIKESIKHEIKTLQREINTNPNRRDLILKLKQLQREYARS